MIQNSHLARGTVALGGACLIVSPFLAWAGDTSGWDYSPAAGILALATGVIAVAAALTGGRIGLFRPDVSLVGAADMFSVTTSVVIGYLILFELPEGADAGAGILLALGSAVVVAAVTGDYSVLRGAPAFPRLDRERTARPPA